MDRPAGPVVGELLRWARGQQGLTLRDVARLGGPQAPYQSEVEHGKKSEVSWGMLTRWLKALSITLEFATGRIPKYHDHRALCQGLALDIGLLIQSSDPSLPNWREMAPLERMREVLILIALRSRRLPRVVLAYVLDWSVANLDAIMNGDRLPPMLLKQILMELTMLPESFFDCGEIAPVSDGYRSVVAVAQQRKIAPEELLALLDFHEDLPALLELRRAGKRPGDLLDELI